MSDFRGKGAPNAMSEPVESYPGPSESPVDQLPTHQAAASNSVDELASLVSEGAELLGPETKETPLHAAAKKGSLDTLRWLLDNKTASPLEKAANGNSPAHYAAVYGHREALKLLVEHDSSLSNQVVTQTDESGLSLLSLATLQGDLEIVQWLIDSYPQVGEIPNANGDLAVHFAAAEGYLDILKILIRKYGKEMAEKQDKNLTKPVYFASQEGQLAVLDYLINELGVDPVAREKTGVSTITAATQAGQHKAVKWLISKLGPKYILDKTIDGATPLHMAAAQSHMDILHYLVRNLENKNDINVLDHIHATPAHDAAEYGQMQALLLLLNNGADISIRDTENKTPYDLALEQSHTDVAAMIADFRDNGPMALAKYERRQRFNTQPKMRQYTSQEAAEVSAAIQHSSNLQEQRKTQQFVRQASLKHINERGLERDDIVRGKNTYYSDNEIEHTMGPMGDIYARPKKRKNCLQGGLQQRSVDDMASPSGAKQNSSSLLDSVLPLDDNTINLETGSNFSQPYRAQRYRDSDSEITSVSRDGRHNIPGFYMPYGRGLYPPPPPSGPRSVISAHSSRSGQTHPSFQGYPMVPYGYYPMVYPPYGYPYPQYRLRYRPKTTEERMHLEALQRGQSPRGPPMRGPTHYHYHPRRGRRSRLRKRTGNRQQSQEPSPAPLQRLTGDIGYGPAVSQSAGSEPSSASGKKGGSNQPPPIKRSTDRVDGSEDVLQFDSNFIMMKKSETSDKIEQLGATTLNMAPKQYDGRWDEYIMTDSELDYEVDDSYCVAYAAEAAAILAIGCVAGLKGLKKMKKGRVLEPEKPTLSSTWDNPPTPLRGHSRRNSISGLADPKLRDMSPEDFAAREELNGQTTWAAEKKTKKKKKEKADASVKPRSASSDHLDKPQSELLTKELQQQSFSSVSRSFGGKMLYNALGARKSSMLDIGSTSMASSLLTPNSSSEGDGEDEFGAAMHMVHGTKPPKQKKDRKKKKKKKERMKDDREQEAEKTDEMMSDETELFIPAKPKEEGPVRVKSGKKEKPKKESPVRVKSGKKEKDKPKEDSPVRVKSGKKEKDKQKAKEEKERKEQEKKEKKKEKMEAKKEQQRKKEEKKAAKLAREKRKQETGTPLTTQPSLSCSISPSSTAPSTLEKPAKLFSLKPKSSPQQHQLSPSEPYDMYKSEQKNKDTASLLKKDRKKKTKLKSLPKQSDRRTQQALDERGKKGKVSVSSTLEKSTGGKTKEPTVKKNPYFEDESDEGLDNATEGDHMMGTEKEKDPGLSELDDVLAQLENIQTGGLMSWLEPNKATTVDQLQPNKVTSVDESSESEDSLPLELPTTPTSPKPKTDTSFQHIPKSPQKQDQFFPASSGTGERRKRELAPPRDEGEKPEHSDDNVIVITSGHPSLQRTKHGSPHPLRAIKGKRELESESDDDSEGGVGVSVHVQTATEVKQSAGIQAGGQETTQAHYESESQRRAFEQNVLSTLEALKDSMNQLKSNPSITQTEMTEQTLLQQQLIQNLITYSQQDPMRVNQLLSILTDKEAGLQNLEELQQKILGAHEKTYLETQEHFRTQEALQRAIQRTLEEQTQQQMKGMQANFDMFSKLMEEQLAEQRRKFEEELKKMEPEEKGEESEDKPKEKKKKKSKGKDHSKKKHKRKHKHYSDTESVSTMSDSEEVVAHAQPVVTTPAVKTMKAKIYTQDLLQENLNPSPNTSKARLFMKRGTEAELFRTTEALGRNLSLEGNDEEEEDEEEMLLQYPRPVTIRRADIKVQGQDDYTPLRPSSGKRLGPQGAQLEMASGRQITPNMPGGEKFDDFHIIKMRPPRQLETQEKKVEFDEAKLKYGRQHVEVNQHKPPISSKEVHPLSGAGDELAAALKLRQRQIKQEN